MESKGKREKVASACLSKSSNQPFLTEEQKTWPLYYILACCYCWSNTSTHKERASCLGPYLSNWTLLEWEKKMLWQTTAQWSKACFGTGRKCQTKQYSEINSLSLIWAVSSLCERRETNLLQYCAIVHAQRGHHKRGRWSPWQPWVLCHQDLP